LEKQQFIDINCDVGEGIGNERELLPLISSCNIACGGHSGDAESMRQTVLLAKQNHVLIGAHPSYPDKENFGRRSMTIAPTVFVDSIGQQIKALQAILETMDLPLNHIKAHGALYNDLAKNEELAILFLKAILPYKESTAIYAAPISTLGKEALKHGFKVVYEAFADRNYNRDLSLVSRSQENAVIKDPIKVYEHLLRMVIDRKVRTVDGQLLQIEAQTYCVHGDTPNALQILMYLTDNLPNQNIYISK